MALEIGADLVLLDEKEGRRAAQRLGLRVAGVLAILLEAKKDGAVDSLRFLMDALRQTAGFYVSDAVYQRVLALAGEMEDGRSGLTGVFDFSEANG